MADKDYDIQDLLDTISLNIPPFLGLSYQTSGEYVINTQALLLKEYILRRPSTRSNHFIFSIRSFLSVCQVQLTIFWLFLHVSFYSRAYKIDLTKSFDKSLYTIRKWKPKDNTKKPQNLYYKTIADRLRTVSWSNYRHLTFVVKPVNGIPTFPPTAKAVQSKEDTIKHL